MSKKMPIQKVRKIYRLLALTIPLLTASAAIAHAELPSESAAREGYKEIIDFRRVLVPLWTEAYPARNFGAMIATAHTLDSLTSIVYKMPYKTRFKDRMTTFNDRKYALMKSVSEFVKAANNNDSVVIYGALPKIQENFESTAVILLPMSYPTLERLIIRAKFLSDTLSKRGNQDEMIVATDSIITMIQTLSPDSLPPKAKDKADLAAEEFAYFVALSGKIKESLIGKDMEKFKTLARELGVRLVNFRYKFLV